MPIAGFIRYRKRQWGYQGSNSSTINTIATATRVIPWRGVPTVNPNWTFPDQDEGSLHKIAAPQQRASDLTSTPAGNLYYDDFPYLATVGLVGGPVAVGGGANKTWTFTPPSLTASPLGMITEQYGDDVLTDWWQLNGGVAESFTLTGNNDMGPLTASVNMRYANWRSTSSSDHPVSGTVPTAGLTVDAAPVPVFMGDGELYLNSSAATIGTTKITDALESMVLTVTNGLDSKRYANGSNTRFAVSGFGLGSQEVTLALTFAKTAQTVGLLSENDLWMDDTPTKRFVELKFTSSQIITGAIPYSLSIRMPMFYTIRGDGEIGHNTNLTLTGTNVYDTTLGYGIRATEVTTLTAL